MREFVGFIIRIDGKDRFTPTLNTSMVKLLREHNSENVNLEVWAREKLERKAYRKSGRVRHAGNDTMCLTRYLVSPKGTTKFGTKDNGFIASVSSDKLGSESGQG